MASKFQNDIHVYQARATNYLLNTNHADTANINHSLQFRQTMCWTFLCELLEQTHM